MNVTMVTWSDLARGQKVYLDRVEAGETFVILHASQPVAVLRPIQPNESITIVIKERDAQ